MQDINDMVVFARVVQAGGFTAAEDTLGLPKSNISRRISRLEEALGVRLLERTTRSIHLTEVGEIYYRHCQRIIEEAENAAFSVDNLMEAPRGLLRVSVSVTTGQQLLKPILPEFMNLYPEIKLQLHYSNRRTYIIEEGFDLAIRIGRLDDSTLIARHIGQSQLFLYASITYLKHKGMPSEPRQLIDHDYLAMSEEIPDHLDLIGPSGRVKVKINPRLIINDFVTLHHAMLNDLGIAVFPNYMCTEFEKSGDLVRVLRPWSASPVDFHVIYPSRRGVTPKARAFIDFVTEKLTARLSS